MNNEARSLLGARDLSDLTNLKKELDDILAQFAASDDPKCTPPKKYKMTLQVPNRSIKKLQCTISALTKALFLIVVRDITKELSFIEDYALLRMEKEARNILQRKKEEELEAQKKMLDRLLVSLPEGVSFISVNRRIGLNNLYTQKIFSKGDNQFCYEFLGRNKPCATCRLDEGLALGKSMVIGHRLGGLSLTENIIPFNDGTGALLVFRDTSRPVELIRKIKEQRDTIKRQKDLFEGLANIMAYMQEEDDPQKVSEIFLALLSKHVESKGMMLLVEGLRRGEIIIEKAIGLDHAHTEGIKSAYLHLPHRSEGILYLKKETLKDLFENPTHCHQYPILKSKDSQFGLLIVDTGTKRPPPQKIITFFLEPFTSYVKNVILTMKLEEKANKDELTGLYNRRYFEQALNIEIEKAEKYSVPFSIIMADANGLKYLNDTYGHQVGDTLIKEVANAFLAVARSTDVVARLGGDEFAVLLPNTPQEDAKKLLSRIKRETESRTITTPENTEYPVSVSLGVAGSDVCGPHHTLKCADTAMYEDKKFYYSRRKRYR